MKKILILFLILFAFASRIYADVEYEYPIQKGVIQSVEYVDLNDNDLLQTKQAAKIKIISGPLKGEIVDSDYILTGNPFYDIDLKKGMKVIMHVDENNGELSFNVEDVYRFDALIIIALIFAGLLLYVGKKKGLYSLVSITISCLLISKLLTPMILSGINPFISALIVALLSTAVTMYFVGGFNRKSTSATLGCILSLLIAGVLSFLTVKFAHLTGFTNENSMFLYSEHQELDFVSITVSAMMLATLGAVMDVGMSIASTINEIHDVDSSKTIKELYDCGMNVGKDIIGTMANTLILVYVGGSLPLLLLASNINFQKFINLNQIVTELSSALIGSIAIVICVPITAFIASELMVKTKEEPDFSTLKE